MAAVLCVAQDVMHRVMGQLLDSAMAAGGGTGLSNTSGATASRASRGQVCVLARVAWCAIKAPLGLEM
jgi:hypothetical protein